MLRHRWSLETSGLMKEARHKKSHPAWFHLHEMFRISKCIETESRSVVTEGWGGIKGNEDLQIKRLLLGSSTWRSDLRNTRSLLWHRFDSWSGNFCMPWAEPEKTHPKTNKKKPQCHLVCSKVPLSLVLSPCLSSAFLLAGFEIRQSLFTKWKIHAYNFPALEPQGKAASMPLEDQKGSGSPLISPAWACNIPQRCHMCPQRTETAQPRKGGKDWYLSTICL